MLLISSTGTADENLVVSLENLNEIYDALPEDAEKLMARRNDADHGEMLYYADGYTTAWFLWKLQGTRRRQKPLPGRIPNSCETLSIRTGEATSALPRATESRQPRKNGAVPFAGPLCGKSSPGRFAGVLHCNSPNSSNI